MERNIFKILNEKNNINIGSGTTLNLGGWSTFLLNKPLEKLLSMTKLNNKTKTCNYLCQIKEYFGLTYAQIVKGSNFKETYIKDVFSGRRKPSRDAVIGLCFVFGLNFDESNMLLKSAGYNELYPRDNRDLLLSKGIIDKLNIREINEVLIQYKVSKIGNFDDDES